MHRADTYWHVADCGEAIAIGDPQEIDEWCRSIRREAAWAGVQLRTFRRCWCAGMVALAYQAPDRPAAPDPREVATANERMDHIFGDPP
jgi:hypothetical protein